ncbi:hypothetical protein D4R78_03715 [bacterium]|nr:MAG: hypothetical protein D4R78_03715 [bacterium]
MIKIRGLILAITLSLSFAILVCFVSNNLHVRFENRPLTIEQQFALLKGESWYCINTLVYSSYWKNRILFPCLLYGVSKIHFLTTSQWYLILRLMTAFLAFLIFWYLTVSIGKTDYKTAGFAMGLLAYELIFTFTYGMEFPTDFLDVIFISLFLWASLCRNRRMLLAAAILAAANRESSVFAGLIWIALYGIDSRRRLRFPEISFAALVSLASYTIVVGLRFLLGGNKVMNQQLLTGWPELVSNWRGFIAQPTYGSWPFLWFAIVTPVFLWIWVNRVFLSPQHKRLLAVAALITCITFVFGTLSEPRTFIPSFVIFILVAALAEESSKLNPRNSH